MDFGVIILWLKAVMASTFLLAHNLYYFGDAQLQMKRIASIRVDTDNLAFVKAKEWNVKLEAVLVYRPITSIGFDYIETRGNLLQLVLEFNDSLDSILAGKYDDELHQLATDIKKKGEVVHLRPLHEFNLSTSAYPWCIYPYTTDKIAKFKRAWRHVVAIFKAHSAPVKFQLCFNIKNPNDDATPYSAFYPGGDVVDMVGIDVYNRCGLDMYHRDFTQFKDLVSPFYARLKNFGKPIFIGETSSTDQGGDKATWIKNAWHALRDDFPRVRIVNFFLENKEARWGLNSDREITEFKNGLRYFEQ